MDRRSALRQLAALTLLSGCSADPPRSISRLSQLCASNQTGPTADGPLVIDVHCHVFNGSDLQVTDFIGKVVKSEFSLNPKFAALLGEMANSVSWLLAPTALDEGKIIDNAFEISRDSPTLSNEAQSALRRGRQIQEDLLQREAVRIFRTNRTLRELLNEYVTSVQSSGAYRALSPSDRRLLERLPRAVNDPSVLTDADVRAIFRLPGIDQIWHLLSSMLQYRYANCFDIVEYYSCAGGSVDLFCPALVDYDHWLGDGSTRSRLADQYGVVEKIMRMMGGNFHAYAPFNPWSHLRDPTYFKAIQSCVLERGFIGVKLYPPMGFAPLGNATVPDTQRPAIWSKPGAPSPKELDGAMQDLYNWCHANCVPILAHAGPSYGPDKNSDALASSTYWGIALDYIKSLGTNGQPEVPNVCFGHIGGAYTPQENRPGWAAGFAKQCQKHANAYGDLSYWDYLSADPLSPQFKAAKAALKTMQSTWSGIEGRLLYGSDWNLLLLSQAWRNYPRTVLAGLKKCGFPDESVARISGPNATLFLGLKSSAGPNSNRGRLDSIYGKKWKVDPIWRSKVNRL